MKKGFAFLLALLGLNVNTACSQQNFENREVKEFAQLIDSGNVQLVDVRTAEEYAEDHLVGALNIDVKEESFVEKATAQLSKEKTVAVYCRSGRRSVTAAENLAEKGYKVVNLLGGIVAWKKAQMTVTTQTDDADTFKTKSGKTLRIHALIHASIRIEYDGQEIEIDPVGKLGNRTTDYGALPKADLILVTHEHMDHFDKEAIKTLTKEGTQLVTNQRCADMYGAGTVMKNGDQREWKKDFSIEAVPAYNTTEEHKKFHPQGRDNGYILTVDGIRIYIAGDTEDIPEMSSFKNIDIAFLPCNQPYTMTTEQFVNAARMVKAKVVYPYHYGQTDVSVLPAQLKADGIEVRLKAFD